MEIHIDSKIAALLFAGVALTGVLAIRACKRGGDETTEGAAPIVATARSARPVDHLAPGELVEGTEVAFGLHLPRDLKLDRRVGNTVYARVQADPASLTKYVETRVHEGKAVREMSGGTLFDSVKSTDPHLVLSVRIEPDPIGSRIEIRDATPPPAKDYPDEAARWRAVGLAPNGKVLDPTHLD